MKFNIHYHSYTWNDKFNIPMYIKIEKIFNSVQK